MTSFEPTCTEPGQWYRAPDADAQASEILAYLQHCDLCEYHAMLNLEDDLSLDVLLRDACRDLAVDDVARLASAQPPAHQRPALASRLRRKGRAPQARLFNERFRFERGLTQACIAAFSIVVLWIAFTAYHFGSVNPAEAPVADVEAPLQAIMPPSQLIADMKAGHLYAPRILSAYQSGQLVSGGVLFEEDQLTVAAPRQIGSVLRVTNPENGFSVEVKVVRRSYEDREIFLSLPAADSLGIDGTAFVFVEVLFTPPPAGLAP